MSRKTAAEALEEEPRRHMAAAAEAARAAEEAARLAEQIRAGRQ